MKKFITVILSVLLLFSAFAFGCGNSSSIQIEYKNGVITLIGGNNVEEYKIYANEKLLLTTKDNSVNVAEYIVKNKLIPYGEWKIKAEGYSGQALVIKSSSDFAFEIKELNSANFANTLNGEYKNTDYFIFSSDIYLYGRGPYNDNTIPSGYQLVNFGKTRDTSIDGGNALFFIKKPFTATIDGNGYCFYTLVDEHISWVQLPFVYGGVFADIASSALVKNFCSYGDYKYEVKSRPSASASFVYKLSGRLENIFFDQINRPFIRQKVNNSLTDNPSDYIDAYDSRVAVVSHALGSASINNCIFSTNVYNLLGQTLESGGAVLFNESENVCYNGVIYISTVKAPRVFNTEFALANSQSRFKTPSTAQNVYYFDGSDDFLNGVGNKLSGSLTRTCEFVEFVGDPLVDFGGFNIDNGELYLFDNQIYFY